MSFFALKISDPASVSLVNDIKAGSQTITIKQLNQLEGELKIGEKVFIQLGGDKVSWDKGLIGLAQITGEPYDKGYDEKNPRNFKLGLKMILILNGVIKREEFRFYVDAYDAGGIGPNTRGEQNQAIKALTDKQAYAILRAMAERQQELANKIMALFSEDECKKIFGKMPCMVESNMTYEESLDCSRNSDGVEEEADDVMELVFNTAIDTPYERNRIVFGAPGTGKSYKLKEDCNSMKKKFGGAFERVTFHPDYTYSQFVGTYKPVMGEDEKIRYTFVPGPFMRVYVEAIKSGRTYFTQPYILLIEEINRAKVAAVFGDVFQLLDRDDDGVSEYEIQASEDIRRYLAKELGGSPDNYKKIRIPNNMYIWATMNSADQGVFPMDTAFKRRWYFEYLGINANDDGVGGSIMLGTDVTQDVEWNTLRKAINEKLTKDYRVNEDKLMGPFFLSKKALRTVSDTDDTIADRDGFMENFKSKIIMYLYEDAAKQYKHKLFSGCEDTTKYSAVCDSFDKIGMQIFGEDFEDAYYNPQKG